ncbi:MAG TPA: NTP transferase domain-containing protein [Acidimicrobiales bacterium]|nr:NTP transferase domain-containing protein [Acidimicrobiales bacterium]
MQLVILAAGHGRRFGGLKQLAPVGPNGEAIMDYTALAAEASGYDGIVLVVREDIREEILAHVRRRWPSTLQVSTVCQPPVPGTAQAVLSARPALHGPFGVANADDLYGEQALGMLIEHFSVGTHAAGDDSVAGRHVLVAYRLLRTVLTAAAVTRGLCEVDEEGELRRIVEHTVRLREDGSFDATPLPRNAPGEIAKDKPVTRRLDGLQRVSMNLWGFHPRLLDHLVDALAHFDPETAVRRELLLPDVVGSLVERRHDSVHVVETDSRCIGVTHQADIAIVREEVAAAQAALASSKQPSEP